jgi:hypothetical protein
VSDSEYWGGAVNSHGITFMVTGDEADIWVCQNEVFDSVGMGVSTKGGSSHVHVIGNYLHDLGTGVEIPDARCDWRGCEEHTYPGGAYEIRENLFERCGEGVAIAPADSEPVLPSRIFNNLFVDTEAGVRVSRTSSPPFVRNNVFLGGGSGIYFSAGEETTWPDYYLARGFDSDHNLFASENAVYVYANWSGTERAFDLASYRDEYGAENASIEAPPALDESYRPSTGSPARGAGDPNVYEGAEVVNIGLWPLLE